MHARLILIAVDFSSAWLLNMRGSDIPFNPLFHAYLFVGLDRAVLFLEEPKANEEVKAYLQSIGVERRNYTEIWAFLRNREWNSQGKVRKNIPTQTVCGLKYESL